MLTTVNVAIEGLQKAVTELQEEINATVLTNQLYIELPFLFFIQEEGSKVVAPPLVVVPLLLKVLTNQLAIQLSTVTLVIYMGAGRRRGQSNSMYIFKLARLPNVQYIICYIIHYYYHFTI